MDLEHYWYETSPFIYTATGGAFLGRAESTLSIVSSILLLTAGGTILFLRRRYGMKLRERLKRPAPRASRR
jgi:hypothetical protein